MAQPDHASEPQPPAPALALSPPGKPKFFRRFFGRHNEQLAHPSKPALLDDHERPDDDMDSDDPARASPFRRSNRRVITGLPRTQTFKRQLSEQRSHLAPVETGYERRAVSVDQRSRGLSRFDYGNPRVSAPGHIDMTGYIPDSQNAPSLTTSTTDDEPSERKRSISRSISRPPNEMDVMADELSMADAHSMTTSQYNDAIRQELETTWILNLSMHFRDRSKREKFFVTYREDEHLWRRVTISLDYRNAVPNSLEWDLTQTEFQREKSAKIYEAIRESLPEIQFYESVTNLKLQTVDGRLIVHVVEDGNEMIPYPRVNQIKYLGCKRVKESDIDFESHMSGFVYKVNVNGRVLIKKEIPSPDTIDEFLYEINALNCLRFSEHVVKFYGVVVDDDDEIVKGLLISYADQGALIDIIYDTCKDGGHGLPWHVKDRWARQIVQGLADIHDSGFVQGDFTLSNIVIDDRGDAKIIDINRRGCPVGWEPPEATALIESNQRISMYIGVKSDLYQLGMVLWALAMEEDEPEREGRPLILGPEVQVPDWYRQMTEICLSYDPRMRLQASSLIHLFPPAADAAKAAHGEPSPISVENGHLMQNYVVDGHHADGHPFIREVEPPSEWPPYMTRRFLDPSPSPHPYEAYDMRGHTRGRSPPSPLPSDCDFEDEFRGRGRSGWSANMYVAPSYSDVGMDDAPPVEDVSRQPTPTPTMEDVRPAFQEAKDEHQVPQDPSSKPTTVEAEPVKEEVAGVDGKEQVAVCEDEASDAAVATPDTVKENPVPITEPPAPQLEDGKTVSSLDADMPDSLQEAIVPLIVVGTEDKDLEQEGEQSMAMERDEKHKLEPEETSAGGSIEPQQQPGTTEPVTPAEAGKGLNPGPSQGSEETGPEKPAISESATTGAETETSTETVPCTIPDSLKGVGAAHGEFNDDVLREKELLDDDFSVAAPAVLPTLTITTDANA